MNWRKTAISILLKAGASNVNVYLGRIMELEKASKEKLDSMQQGKLAELVEYCYRYVPYYKSVLENAGVVKRGGAINLDNFSRIAPLTKSIIRNSARQLLPTAYRGSGRYENTSGGSTGEPVKIYQDSRYEQWNTANKLYFNIVLGKYPGDKEIKLWGSDRDIIKGTLTVKDRAINFLYNRRFFNCYRLDDAALERLRLLNNSFKPVGYWSYMEAALELADYIGRSGREFYPPKLIVSTIAPLTEGVRNKIERNLKCDVYNQYGSREVGAIACECTEKDGLHTFPWAHYVEVADDFGNPVGKGGQGQVLVTPLENYAMPMLRYAIGDVAVDGGCGCRCGANTFKLAQITGRTLGYFVKADDSLVHSHFIVQALFFRDWIERFQIVQPRKNHIRILVVKKQAGCVPAWDIEDITEKCRILLGPDCGVEFEYVDDIAPSQSGKYLYTVCEVRKNER